MPQFYANLKFKNLDAILIYSRVLQLDLPTEIQAVIYSNRSVAYLRLDNTESSKRKVII